MTEATTIAFIGSYPPRRCGIASFTNDLRYWSASATGDDDNAFVVALNDTAEGYTYGKDVKFEVRENVQRDYRLAADYLNIRKVSAVCLQHEYGLFGGPAGSHILAMLRRLRRPLVTTLHTVVSDPSDEQTAVMKEIARLSSRIVVLSDCSGRLLADVYGVGPERIVTIPHGIPDMPFVDPDYYKDLFGVEGKTLLLTFGLLSPGKGIEYAIGAMPEVIRRFPDVVYVVVGATHPKVRRQVGEQYRNSLMHMVDDLKLQDHVIFRDRFVEPGELIEYLGATDIYITPYLGEGQVVSGTLAYAMGSGKAVVSTPYKHAREMLADGRGWLVKFRDSSSIAKAVISLLEDDSKRLAMRKQAYIHTRQMLWSTVGKAYLKMFEDVRDEWSTRKRPSAVDLSAAKQAKSSELPEVELAHMIRMTDDTGMFQHCRYDVPDRVHGYCTDDNARALVVAMRHWNQMRDENTLPAVHVYVSFLAHAFDATSGRFRNFMTYDRRWVQAMGSEDSHGRAMWALGTTVAHCPKDSIVALMTQLFADATPVVENFTSPRAWAFTLLGMDAYLRRFGGDSQIRRCRANLARKLLALFKCSRDSEWPWCEEKLAYCNAKLSHAMLTTGIAMQKDDMIDIGLESLRWLVRIQTNNEGAFSFVGTSGRSRKNMLETQFDQQPIEAHAMAEACLEAHRATGDEWWLAQTQKAYRWFLGHNDLRVALVDFSTGGCRDGLHSDGVNENQGAESTLAWLMSLLIMHQIQAEQNLQKPTAVRLVPKASAGIKTS